MPTLPELLQSEIQRCRQVAETCASLGSSGAFASALLQQALREADAALKCRDVALIQQSIDRLRTYRDVSPDVARPTPSTRTVAPTLRTPQGPRPLWVPNRPAPREQFFTWVVVLPDPAHTWRDDSLTALLSRRSWEESRLPNPWPMSEMAAWDPADDDSDAGQAFSEADQRSLLALGLVAALALVLVAASGVLSFISR